MNKTYIWIFILTSFVISSCVTAPPKDAYTASTSEILFTDSVQKYLAARRLELQKLQNRATELDDILITKLGEFHALEKSLKKAQARTGASNRELAQLQREVAQKKAEAEAAYQKTNSLKVQIDEMNRAKIETEENQKRDIAQINTLNEEITQLEQEKVVLDRAIVRNLNLKAEQVLRNDGTN